MPRFQARDGKRLHWRVTVQSAAAQDGSRGGPKMTWHMVECADPLLAAAHCTEGSLLVAAGADPDGHCLVDEACPRCALLNAAPAAIVAPQTAASVATVHVPEATPSVSTESRQV